MFLLPCPPCPLRFPAVCVGGGVVVCGGGVVCGCSVGVFGSGSGVCIVCECVYA